MNKVTYRVVGILSTIGLMFAFFQNCAPKTSFDSSGQASLSASSTQPQLVATPTPSPMATPGTQFTCASYMSVQNSGAQSSWIKIVQIPVGGVVNQSVGCNTRPMSVGYQNSYCNNPVAGCGNCTGALGNWACTAEGSWVASSAATPTSSVPASGCYESFSGVGFTDIMMNSQADCATNCRLNSQQVAVQCYYNGVAITY